MDSNESLSIIHKKARVAREDFDARAMSPAKALRVSLAKTADEAMDLALVVTTLEQTVVSTEELLSKFDGQGLLILMDGAGGARGVAMLDCQVVSAVIEQQISGQVRAQEAELRSYTRTDAAMVAPLLDATLEGFDAQLLAHHEAYQPGNFRFGDKMDDTRALSLALEGGGRFDLFRLTLDLAEGAKTGAISIALPKRVVANPTGVKPGEERALPTGNLEKLALGASVTLSAVLARLNHPLRDICALKPGMVLPLPAECLGQSELVAPPRHVVAEVVLGQVNGMRAVRIMMQGGEKRPVGQQLNTDDPMPDRPAVTMGEADLDLSASSPPLPEMGEEELPSLPDLDLPGMDADPGDDDDASEDFDLDLPDLPSPLPALP